MSILVADDHPFTRRGIANFITLLGHTVTDTCDNGITAFNLIQRFEPTIAVLDINMPGLGGLEIAAKIQKQKLPTRVVLVTLHNERSLYKKAVEYGVYGYLLKNFSEQEMESCLRAVFAGQHYASAYLEQELVVSSEEPDSVLSRLTLTERKVLELISQQKSSKQIATLLFCTEKTIEGHRRNILEKLQLPKEKNQLLIWALEHRHLFLQRPSGNHNAFEM